MYNNRQLLLGTFLGVLVPALVMLLMYVFKFKESSLDSFLHVVISQGIASAIIVLAVLGNLGLFFLCLWRDKLWAARGVIIATLLYGMLMLYFKLQA